jgi:hypothetical protein
MKIKRLLLIMSLVFMIGGLVCSCGGGNGGDNSQAVSPGSAQPSLYVFAATNKDVVHSGETLNIGVTVENRGVGKAENLIIYFEPSAQGYALLEKCNYPIEAIVPVGAKVKMGDIFPDDKLTATLEVLATDKAASEPETVMWAISHDYYGGAKVKDTTLKISFSSAGVPFGGSNK